jgi:hypothetical protein
MTESSCDDLLAEAEAKLEELEQGEPDDWGYAVSLNEGDRFTGWYRRQETDETAQFGPRPIYLLQATDGEACHLKGGRVSLDREMENAAPNDGDQIVIGRGSDGEGDKGNTFHRYVVRSRPPAEGKEAPALVSTADIPY